MEWSNPNMAFGRSSIWAGNVSADGDVVIPVCVAGGSADVVEAPPEPRWSPQGDLLFVSDRATDSGIFTPGVVKGKLQNPYIPWRPSLQYDCGASALLPTPS
ncbi:hypothetical protein KC19_6G089100 [Ceratodon purpureus]|uniref:Uncharacterized protein n=1 Tax=Ceratodon purpureus TaxID=3225 RepID=A0A8T0HG12_CERPU|nr:hypothetical protein KC19_6G089100 [Ceratodon purpureus]